MNNNKADELSSNLLALCNDNKLYFEKQKDEKGRKLFNEFVSLEEQIENFLPLKNEIEKIAPNYDFKDVQANGYRSFIIAANKFFTISTKINKHVRENRSSIFFHKPRYTKEIQDCIKVFSSLNDCFQLLQLLNNFTCPSSLFLYDPEKIDTIEKFFDRMNVESFYGRFIGFQYGEDTQVFVGAVAIMMAAFSEYYFNDKNVFQCAALGSKYFSNPDLRSQRIAIVTNHRKTTVNFCKSFWNISEHEIIKKVNVILQPKNVVNEIFELPGEPIQYKNGDSTLEIPVPSIYIGVKPLRARLISSIKRKGMEYFKNITSSKKPLKPTSDWLIFHVHGGGFISQTSESHQMYLKDWSKWIDDTPIISVDYSLAPESPYPRALEEIVYAYVWALNNHQHLGSTAKRIVIAGDSAGGNLCLGLTLKCIELGIRKPDGIFCAYTPTCLQFYPCPSRFLGFMDPILSFGFMLCSIKAYVHVKNDFTTRVCPNSTESSESGKLNTAMNKNSIGEDDVAEKLSTKSSESEEEKIQPSDPSDLSTSKKNSFDSPETDTDSQTNDDTTLPLKYKNIIKGFLANLKDTIILNASYKKKNENTFTSDFDDIPSLTYLIDNVKDDIFLSPTKADDKYLRQFPRISILTVEMDPCIDDSVTMAKKLDEFQKDINFEVLPNVAHGFLNVSLSNKEAYYGSMLCAQRIKELLLNTPHSEFKKI